MTQQATETEFDNIHTSEWNLANRISTDEDCSLIEAATSEAKLLSQASADGKVLTEIKSPCQLACRVTKSGWHRSMSYGYEVR
jgi:hypothetical protein